MAGLHLNCGGILSLILAIVFPPLGVLLHNGCSNAFWIDCLLTLLGFLPGVIYAIYIICNAPKTVANPHLGASAGGAGVGVTV